MTTTSVSTPASSAPTLPVGVSSATRQSGKAGNPFQQMLSNEIRDKTRNTANSAERNPDTEATNKAAPAAPADKKATSASAIDTSTAQGRDDNSKEEAADSTTPVLSPELAAMVASLLQRQTAAADGKASTAEGEANEAELHELLDGAKQRPDAEAQAKDKKILDLANTRQAMTGNLVSQTAAQTLVSSQSELDLKAQPTDFNSVLQLNQTVPKNAGQPDPQVHLAPRMGTQGWDQALGQRVVWMAHGAEHSASLTLNPPELGPLQVTLNVSNNQAQASFVAPHADVRQALEAALPRLREMLEEVGIQLGQASVNQGSPQQQEEFARSNSQGGSDSGASAGDELPAVETTVSSRMVSIGKGLVDTFA